MIVPGKWKNGALLLASLVFYAWGEPKYVFLMITLILFNYFAGIFMEQWGKTSRGKAVLWGALAVNVGILCFFKFSNVAWPIGISFYTFQLISYLVDVYRRTAPAQKNLVNLGTYVTMFPQLIAGPIVRYEDIEKQLGERKHSAALVFEGSRRFLVGLSKKILISNALGELCEIFKASDEKSVLFFWIYAVGYTLQIYFDFSAYSDMAIGLGLCFGFKFGENFNYPYIADSVSDFWKRWHISLTDWFREYIYFPLGGSRVKNQDFMVRNMFLVWLLTGIWHGANWTFIFWGLYYFVFQLAERFFEYPQKMKIPFFKHVYTLLVVNTAWVIFRADDLYQAGRFFMNMLGLNNNGFYSDLAVMLLRENWVFLVLGIIFSMPVARRMNELLYKNPDSKINKIYTVLYPIGMLLLLIVSVSYLASGSYNPFIYFNF